jgi:RNA polymerase sigma factor (sigma-70 family)
MTQPAPQRHRNAPAGVDWDAQPLGKESDQAIARRLGVSSTAAAKTRRVRKIKPAPQVERGPRLITFQGETHDLTGWSRRLGLAPATVGARLDRYGWPVERALTVGVDPKTSPAALRKLVLTLQAELAAAREEIERLRQEGTALAVTPAPPDPLAEEADEAEGVEPEPPILTEREIPEAEMAARLKSVEGWVYRTALRALKRLRGGGMDLDDLLSEGRMGAMRAARSFDEGRGFKFLTYAGWWIRHYITRAIADQDRTIRVPVHATENPRKAIERAPTGSFKQANLINRLLGADARIDAPVIRSDDGRERMLGETLADADVLLIEDELAKEGEAVELHMALAELPERLRRILIMRGNGLTLEDVAQKMQPRLTRERVRQLEVQGKELAREALARRGIER